MYSTVAAIGSESAVFRVMKGAVMRSEVEEGNGMKEKKMSDSIWEDIKGREKPGRVFLTYINLKQDVVWQRLRREL